MSARWDPRSYASLTDPCHKSDLSAFLGSYGCPARFRYSRQEDLSGEHTPPHVCDGRRANGNAIHELLRAELSGEIQPHSDVDRQALWDEAMALEADGRPVEWGKGTEEQARREAAHMLRRAVASVPGIPVLAEAGFISPLDQDGRHLVEGHIDLVYRNPDSSVGILDWKTGQQLPDPIELAHGWEGGIYSLALRDGLFIPFSVVRNLRAWGEVAEGMTGEQAELVRTARDHRHAMHALLRNVYRRMRHHPMPEFVVRFRQQPESIYHVHLRDFIPYMRGGKRRVERAEHIAFYDLDEPGQVSYAAGDLRGPGLYQAIRYESDVPRLRAMLRQFIGSVRMGHFPPAISEQCKRCRYREPCLTSGYEVRGEEKRALQLAIRGLDADAFQID